MSDELEIHEMTQEQRDVLCNPVNGMRVGNKVYHDGEWLELVRVTSRSVVYDNDGDHETVLCVKLLHPISDEVIARWWEECD